jgi:NAD-dependent deacetylase
VERVRHWIREASRVVVVTGAGVSAESGVPTFRGEEGLWKCHRPEELATPEAFRRDPRLVWEWYGWRRELVASCRPNPGHEALARWQLRTPEPGRTAEATPVVTQNVDGLHTLALERARSRGNDEEAADEGPEAPVMEIHGSLFRVRCTECGDRRSHRKPIDASDRDTLPGCPACGGLLRPDVVWFGESLDPALLDRAARAAREADLCLVVGTSGVVQPAASLPLLTREAGGRVVEVNPRSTPLSGAAHGVLRGPAGELLPRVLG